ncbi:MAG: hypothetical protein LWW86_12570 [Micrococcales bacterium]|nr:hypothetical protein [Micrococcales bacterium]
MEEAPASVAQLCEAMWRVEDELDLLSWRSGPMAPWPVIRPRLQILLAEATGAHGRAHPRGRDAAATTAVLRRQAAGLLSPGPLARRGRHPLLVLPHPRKVAGREWYTEAVRAAYPDAPVLDSARGGSALPGAMSADGVRSAAVAAGRVAASRPATVLTRRDLEVLARIEQRLEQETGARLPVTRLAAAEAGRWRLTYPYYRRVLRHFGTRSVVLVIAYFNQDLVAAAHDLGAEVIEPQHGVISPYHLGYSWPGRPDVPHQPDRLWTLGSAWATTLDLAASVRAETVGCSWLPRGLSGPRDPALLLVLSQGTVTAPLAALARDVARLRPDLRVVLRLHPSERRDDVAPLVAGSPVVLSQGQDAGAHAEVAATYVWQSRATWQLGVSSTALFEGLALGCRTLVADLAGHEYLSPVIERGEAVLVRGTAEVAAALPDAPLARDQDAWYAAPVATLPALRSASGPVA